MDFLIQFAQGSLGNTELALEYGLLDWPRVISPLLDRIAAGQYSADMGQQLFALCKEFSENWVKNHKNDFQDSPPNRSWC